MQMQNPQICAILLSQAETRPERKKRKKKKQKKNLQENNKQKR